MGTLSPGSNGWINKYFDLVEKGHIDLCYLIPEGSDETEFIHAALGRTGIMFGYPSRLVFARNLNDANWTTDEKIKLLLFEAQLLVYLISTKGKQFDRNEFISSVLDFYSHYKISSYKKVISFILRQNKEEKLENILALRVDIKLNLLENKFWTNYLNNVFNYLDVVLFNDYLIHQKRNVLYDYDEYAMNALNAISMAVRSDGEVEAKEKSMFALFLASAHLSDLHREMAEQRFEKGGSFNDFTEHALKNVLFKRFLIDLSAFTIFANHEAVSEEREHLKILVNSLNFGDNELNNALALTEQFILNNQDKIPFLKSSSSIEKIYGSLSKRWIKILGRNKDKLATELKQSKELVFLIKKSTTTELTKEEKEAIKTQFKDLVKSMPSLAIFMLPGGAVLLPIVLKIIPDLVPSAFRNNEIEK